MVRSQREAKGDARAHALVRRFEMGTMVATPGIEILMFRDCPFCGRTHRSAYVDELERAVMACRDKAAPEDRGSLEAWEDRETFPVLCEIEAFCCGP